jgi:hypothetical protein
VVQRHRQYARHSVRYRQAVTRSAAASAGPRWPARPLRI